VSESDNQILTAERRLGTNIAVIRGYFGTVSALANDRDQALYEALYHCGDAIGDTIEHPDAFKTIADAGRAKGRDIPTRFIDLATQNQAGESTLNDERRASYAAAGMWFATPELTGEDIEAGGDQQATIAKARELGGIDGVKDDPSRPGIANLYRRHRPWMAIPPITRQPAGVCR